MAESKTSLQDLPPHLLYKILIQASPSALDLVHIEASCFAFRAPHGILPLRFKSVVEIAALDLGNAHPMFASLPPLHRMQLLRRCGSNWKMLLRFLQSVEQAKGLVSTPKGKVQVAAGKYHSILFNEERGILAFGSGLPLNSSDQQVTYATLGLLRPFVMPQKLLVTQIASSYKHAAFITSTGELYTYGDNECGCCGLEESNETIAQPTLVMSLSTKHCKQVSTGMNFTMVLTAEGHVYTFGRNAHGQLGHGDTVKRHIPTKVERLQSLIVQVSAGASHALAVAQDGALFSWGYGGNACLGHGIIAANETQPRLMQKFKDANVFTLSVSAGFEHSVALDSNGQVYTWGKGYCGALGQGHESDLAIPHVVAGLKEIRAVQVCASKRRTFVLSDNGKLFAFGWMALGSLGLTDEYSSEKVMKPTSVCSLKDHHISQVSGGTYHTLVVTNKGTILGFGNNDRGQLGPSPSTSNCSQPIELAL